jgi:cysteinyl-tRNA synthetase
MIRSEGEKMAKSVGNIFLLREVLARYAAPVVLVYFLTSHYRSPLEFSLNKLDEAKAAYDRLTGALRDIDFRLATAPRAQRRGLVPWLAQVVDQAAAAFDEHMDDDFNTAAALGVLFRLIGDTYRYLTAVDRDEEPLDIASLRAVRDCLTDRLAVLLIRPRAGGAQVPATEISTAAGGEVQVAASASGGSDAAGEEATRLAAEGRWTEIERLYGEALARGDASYAAVLRDHARAERDWARADALRAEIAAAGFEVRDTKQGTQVVPKRA